MNHDLTALQNIKKCSQYLQDKYKLLLYFGGEIEFYFHYNIALVEENKNIEYQNLKQEIGPNQYEINTKVYNCGCKFANTVGQIKNEIIRITSINKMNTQSPFEAKPFLSLPGSSLHINMSFSTITTEQTLHIIGGLCHSIKNDIHIFAPQQSSYMRYKYPDINTPTTISWGNLNNRTVAIRKIGNRIEHRVPGADCNPYEVTYCIINAIKLGLEEKILPPEQTYGISSDSIYMLDKIPTEI